MRGLQYKDIPNWPAFIFYCQYNSEKNTYFAEFVSMLIIQAKDDPSQKYRVFISKKHETVKRDETSFRMELLQVLNKALNEAEFSVNNYILTEDYVMEWNRNLSNFPITKFKEDGTGINYPERMEPQG